MSSDAIVLMNDARRHRCPLHHGPTWRDPITGTVVPKTFEANLRFRKELLDLAATDEGLQDTLRYDCSRSYLLWMNLFGWTYRKKMVHLDGTERSILDPDLIWWPFITWPVQDYAALTLLECIGAGKNAIVDKSRDMGATWLVVSVLHWLWQFHAGVDFLEVSRKEELVDRKGSPKTLFWKHDKLLARQPAWLVPRFRRVHLLLENLSLGSTIGGEATTSDVGQGDRVTAAAVDEASRVRELDKVESALADTTSSVIYLSTPNGPSHFSKLRFGGTMTVVTMGYWDHPEKGRGRKLAKDRRTGKVYWSTPWLERERFKRSKDGNLEERAIAENILIDHMSSGSLFFDTSVIARQRARAERAEVIRRGWIRFRSVGDIAQVDDACRRREHGALEWADGHGGDWRLWIDLVQDPRTGLLRPPPGVYVMGVDISRGTGASNSTICVADRDRGIKVAEFASAQVGPYMLARQACIAGLFFRGPKNSQAFLVWENNGPGGEFRKEVLALRYTWMYYKSRIKGVSMVQGDQPGWDSTTQSKHDLLEDYRGALANDDIVNLSPEALDEASEYIFFDDGGIGPGALKEESANARATHGDRVIGDGLMWLGCQVAPRMPRSDSNAPVGSVAHRRAAAKKEGRAGR